MVINMAKRTKKLDLKDTLEKVKEALLLLPGEQERQRLTGIIPEIINELQALQDNISRFPNESDVKQVSQAIQTVVSFFDTVRDRPLLAEVLFPKKTKTKKTKSISVDIDAVLKLLEGLPTEKIPEELFKHKKDTLIDLAIKLNISVNTKLKKDALADKIFKLGFANKRGYSLLSGEVSE